MSCRSHVESRSRRRITGAFALVTWYFTATSPPALAEESPAVFQPPLTITRGGAYTGNYRSDDSDVPAITVATTEPVEITGCRIVSAGIHIKAYGGTQLDIHHNTFTGQPPTGGQQWGRVLDDYHPQTLVFEHNTVDHTGGLLVDHSDENTQTAVIRYNLFRNTDSRRADRSDGDHRAAIQFNTVLPIDAEIAWNQFENLPNESRVEDNINLYNSGGRPAAPIDVHDNLIRGAYPYPLDAEHFTGSGITVEGDPAHNELATVSQHIRVRHNQVISTCNAGINVNAGHDIDVQFNTIISAGVLPDGTKGGFFWAGAAVWDGSQVGPEVFKNITFENNTIGYVRPGSHTPLENRQDTSGGVDLSRNTCLPNPITLETEREQGELWQAKLRSEGKTVGNSAK
jgi:hypothetical protein